MKKLILLGGSGFIGQNFLRRLTPNRFQTVIVDRNQPRFHQPDRYLSAVLAETEKIAGLVEKGDVVLHLVHQGLPAESATDPAAELQLNLYPFLRLLSALAPREPSLFLYSSSGGQIYGQAQSLPILEDAPTRPISAYGVVKLAMEHYLRVFAPTAGIPYLIVRLSNPYGPYQEQTNRHGAVPAIMRVLLRDETFTIYGRGDTIRDYIHVDDVVNALLKLIESDRRNEVYNIGAGQGTRLSDLIARIEEIAGKKLKTRREAIRSTDVLANVLDPSRLKQATGWQAQIPLDRGLSLTWEYLKTHAAR